MSARKPRRPTAESGMLVVPPAPPPTDRDMARKREISDAMARLREIAVTSDYNALSEGPVNPDRLLLDLCAEALHALVHAERSYKARDWGKFEKAKTEEERAACLAERAALLAEHYEGIKSAKGPMIRIMKLKATTAAGIYAKAAVVRASKTGAAGLAMSLAEDLLDCPGLRSALWPAGEV